MTPLPVIAGFGGINPAGRVSFHHAYRRTVIDVLGEQDAAETYRSLAGIMKVEGDASDHAVRKYIRNNTLVRRIGLFDPEEILFHRSATLTGPSGNELTFVIPVRQLPDRVPENWSVKELSDDTVEVSIDNPIEVLLPDRRTSRVTSAGQVPTGFDPGALYPSRNHPRGLQLTVYGASDAVHSIGIDWKTLRRLVPPDAFAVYSGSAMGQLDQNGLGGMLQAPMMGKRPTSKQAALGLCEMPTDFINAYILGSVGSTGAVIGACATFLYNLKQGIDDIRSGHRRVALVGGAEAPITPEIIEGYRIMGALTEDEALMTLDGTTEVDNRRACRPFSVNAGFTLAEAAVYVVLMDDELALELGAEIYGSVPDVFVNADGFKKSIPSPGIGNYVTMAKAMAAARSLIGDDGLRERSYIHAHGTGTPQNRVTESEIMNELAKTFGITNWPVAAVKAYLGHTLAPASGDQLTSALGTWKYGFIPGIATIDHIADDVHASHLTIGSGHIERAPESLDVAFINSKGFGGNNATGLALSPNLTLKMLEKRHGRDELLAHARRNESVREKARDYDQQACHGEATPIYQFGEGVLEGEDLDFNDATIQIPGFEQPIELNMPNPFADMTD
ncbi:MAG TPA: beta-ketoacyl synthase [Pseudomonadales bacterium]|nr:beta-ketoacyl synthase [Gammaproteobacteria bacterium]HIM35760.1 beta-ketoacyl synthase [Pseudomonadales bacterium]